MPPAGYQFKIFPTVRLREVYVTVIQLDSTGQVLRVLVRGDSLQRAPYGERQPISVRVADPGPPGFYRVEISARTFARERAVTIDPVIFFHPGR
jgi:hypothetical protein